MFSALCILSSLIQVSSEELAHPSQKQCLAYILQLQEFFFLRLCHVFLFCPLLINSTVCNVSGIIHRQSVHELDLFLFHWRSCLGRWFAWLCDFLEN